MPSSFLNVEMYSFGGGEGGQEKEYCVYSFENDENVEPSLKSTSLLIFRQKSTFLEYSFGGEGGGYKKKYSLYSFENVDNFG